MTDRLTDEQLRDLSAVEATSLRTFREAVMGAELLELRTWRDRMVALMRRATNDPELFQRLFESDGPDLAVSLTRVLDERDQLRQDLAECIGLQDNGVVDHHASHAGLITRLSGQVETLRQQLGSARGQAGARLAEAVERRAQVEARDQRIKELETELAEAQEVQGDVNATAVHAGRVIADKDARIAGLKAGNDARDGDIDRLGGMLHEAETKVAELKADVREAHELLASCREERDRMAAHLRQIVAEHQPIMVRASRHATHDVLFETRCRRCHTDEHHTWANDNYMPWPCPTVRGLVAVCVPAEREVATDGE